MSSDRETGSSSARSFPGRLLVSRYLSNPTDVVRVPVPSLAESSTGSPTSLSLGILTSETTDIRAYSAIRRQVSSASSSRNIASRGRLRSRSRSRSVGQIESNRAPMTSLPTHERLSRTKKTLDTDIYLEGPRVYTCSQCRTHFTSHDDIISKSFHGRHGRAYLLDQCVNISTGPPEDRLLITGLHSVCDIFCNRCKELVGWTYSRAYEPSQKYKEGKFILEKINLHMEERPFGRFKGINFPAGEKCDRWRKRAMSWGKCNDPDQIIYEYHPKRNLQRARSMSMSTGQQNDDPSTNSDNNVRPFPFRSMSLPGPVSPRRF